jgi:hypothetical protein
LRAAVPVVTRRQGNGGKGKTFAKGQQPEEADVEPIAKVSQEEAHYTNSPHGDQRCATCTYFLSEERRCTVVAGIIDPNGWSRFYQPG